jgi:outer membrane lipoprotein-sorting protein
MLGERCVILSILFGLSVSSGLAVAETPPASAPAKTLTRVNLTAAQIVDKHVAARGGLSAWRAVQTMSLSGKMDAGSGDSQARAMRVARRARAPVGNAILAPAVATADKAETDKQVQLPFALRIKRPNQSRLEIEFAGKTAIQVYDGTQGWKVRPFLNRNTVEPFTAQEAKVAADTDDMVDALVDYAAKGTKVELEGVEPVAGHDCYKLKLTMKGDRIRHVWIDTQSFLDVKVEGTPRRMDGRMRDVWVYQRDFRPVQGVQMPFLLETAVDGYPGSHRMVIEKVAVNPKLDDALFTKPN